MGKNYSETFTVNNSHSVRSFADSDNRENVIGSILSVSSNKTLYTREIEYTSTSGNFIPDMAARELAKTIVIGHKKYLESLAVPLEGYQIILSRYSEEESYISSDMKIRRRQFSDEEMDVLSQMVNEEMKKLVKLQND